MYLISQGSVKSSVDRVLGEGCQKSVDGWRWTSLRGCCCVGGTWRFLSLPVALRHITCIQSRSCYNAKVVSVTILVISSAPMEICLLDIKWWVKAHVHCASVIGLRMRPQTGHARVFLSFIFLSTRNRGHSDLISLPIEGSVSMSDRLPCKLSSDGLQSLFLLFAHSSDDSIWVMIRES